MKLNSTVYGAIAIAAMFLIGCQTAPKSEEGKSDLEQSAQTALSQTCQNCHGAYRERLEDGTYRLKAAAAR